MNKSVNKSITAAAALSLSRSMEVASVVMQRSRAENLSTKALALASLSANDNYDRGKRKKKPTNAIEARNEPNTVIREIAHGRNTVKEYIGGKAVAQDKFYLRTCEPGVRDRNSLDESVSRFMAELKGERPTYGLISPEKMRIINAATAGAGAGAEMKNGGDSMNNGGDTLLPSHGDYDKDGDNESRNNEKKMKKRRKKKKRIISNREVLAVTPLAEALGRARPPESYYDRQVAAVDRAVRENLAGKPNDPRRFDSARHKGKHSGVPADTRGFGVLGGSIDIAKNGYDPRITGGRSGNAGAGAGAGGSYQSLPGDAADINMDDGTALNLHSQSLHQSPLKTGPGAGPGAGTGTGRDRGVTRADSYDDEATLGSYGSEFSGGDAGGGVEAGGSHASVRTPASIVGIEVRMQGRSVASEDGPNPRASP